VADPKQLAVQAERILNDPILLRKLGDRVYKLLQEDIRNQCDRTGHYRRTYR